MQQTESHTASEHSSDSKCCAGYAFERKPIAEIRVCFY